MNPTTRWHLRNIGLIFLFMYGWAFLADENFFDLSSLAISFAAWLLVVAIYVVMVAVFKLGPPPEKPDEPNDDQS